MGRFRGIGDLHMLCTPHVGASLHLCSVRGWKKEELR